MRVQDLSTLLSGNVIDTRDILSRWEELTEELQSLETAVEEAQELFDGFDGSSEEYASIGESVAEAEAAKTDWNEENGEELTQLGKIVDEIGEDTCRDGSTLIADSHFKRYAQELADEIGAINSDASWPMNCIDWDQAVRELQMDYSSITIDGHDWWVRH